MKLATIVDEYITFKRSMGMRFGSQAVTLKHFRRTMGPIDIAEVNSQSILAFLHRAKSVTTSWHQTFSILHGLYRFALTRQYVDFSPLSAVVSKPKGPTYAKPYIYSTEELQLLLQASQILDSEHKFGNFATLTFRTLILLLYGAGLRISEALSLTMRDVDLPTTLLTIRESKFFKSRLVPIGPKLTVALESYVKERRILYGRPEACSVFFINRRGTALTRPAAERYFRFVRKHSGISRTDGAHFQPRLHDLRSSFAVHRLVAWYREGADVQRLLPQLSTYLGHVGVAETQVYLNMTPELLREANRRFEQYALLEASHVR